MHVCAKSEGTGDTMHMCRLVFDFTAHLSPRTGYYEMLLNVRQSRQYNMAIWLTKSNAVSDFAPFR